MGNIWRTPTVYMNEGLTLDFDQVDGPYALSLDDIMRTFLSGFEGD